jgi:hypothetical protein
MAKHFHPSRFGWPTARGAGAAALIGLALVLGACVPPKPQEPLAYRFSVASFKDVRKPEDKGLPTPFPFRQAAFFQELRNQMPYTLFGSEDAGLHLTLTHYEATSHNGSYALSMVFGMKGTDQHRREITSPTIMCSAVQRRGFEAADYAQQVWDDKNLYALTPEARDQKMWDRVFSACVESLAEQFGQAMLADGVAPKEGAN